MGSTYIITDRTVGKTRVCPTRDLKADCNGHYRPSPLYQQDTITLKTRVECLQNSIAARSEAASECAAPAESNQKGLPGTDSVWEAIPAAKGLQTRAPWLCCSRVIWYFPTWSASSPGQQERDVAETSFF